MPPEPTDDLLTALLVIDGRQRPLSVDLMGKALVISGEGLAPRLHPIHAIDRAIVLGDVLLAARALRALADADRPLALADSDGRVRAVLRAFGRRRTPMAELLDRLAKHPHWPSRIEDWGRARASRLARGLVPDPSAAARLGPAAPEALLNALVSASRARRARLAAEARSHARLLALASLSAAGVPDRWTGGSADPTQDLTPIFTTLALWHLVRLLRRHHARFAEAFASETQKASAALGPRAYALLAELEPTLRQALATEARLFFSWALDLTAPGTFPEEGYPWPG